MFTATKEKEPRHEYERQDDEKTAPPASDNATQPANPTDFVYPSGFKLALLLISIYIGMFLVALDKLIITTAIPAITNEFHAANDVGWYGTAYLLPNCAFLLVFGKLYTFLDVKATFLAAVLLFEIGSAICGAAPSSIAFIIGRAIAGLGAGGVQSGVITIIVYAVPLEKRPLYQGLFGVVYGISSVLGPLVGGAFTTNVTWRWCFYINLPLGGVVMLFVFLFLHIPSRSMNTNTLKHKLQQLNAEGLIALIPGVICLCLALQWGGFTYSAIKGDSAVESGIHLLPQVLALVVASILTGVLTGRVGYYTPFLIFGICVTAVGAGLLTTLGIDSTMGQWIGYQILYGWGFGACIQAPNMAAQTVLPREEVSIGASVMLFAQTLFGAIFVSIGQNVLDGELSRRLAGITTITPKQIENAGVTGILETVPPQHHTIALEAYNDSLRVCFQVALVVSCLCILGGLSMEWRSVKKQKESSSAQES
ncbi:MFS multidrug transporter [Ilyonectria robusta]